MDFRVCYTWPQWGFGRDGTGGANVVTVLCLPARDHGACSHLSASLIPLGRVCGFQCVSPPGLSLFLRTLLFLMLL